MEWASLNRYIVGQRERGSRPHAPPPTHTHTRPTTAYYTGADLGILGGGGVSGPEFFGGGGGGGVGSRSAGIFIY